MSDIRRRLMMLKESHRLPKEYYRCEYIECSGKQYIDTGFVPNNNTRVVATVVAPHLDGVANYIFGAQQSASSSQFTFGANVNGYYSIGYGTNSASLDTKYNTTDPFTIDVNKNITYYNGEQVATIEEETFSCTTTLTLFGYNTNGSVFNFGNEVRFYSCKIYDGNNLIRNYIPCLNPNGIAGLYDTVTNIFYSSETNSELDGKVILPDGYTWLNYIYSSGNAYIDTGFKHNQNTRVVMKAQCTVLGTPSAHMYLFEGAQANGYRKGIHWNINQSKWGIDYGSDANRQWTTGVLTDVIEVDYNKNVVTVNSTTVTFAETTFQSTVTLALFCTNWNGVPQYYMTGKLYRCRVYDNDMITRIFIPCVNGNDIHGLYDLVNNVFYSSSGTEQFKDDPTVYDFPYTGSVQQIVLKPGVYKLEAWGAEGGYRSSNTYAGKGGYSTGQLTLTENTKLFVYAGGSGKLTGVKSGNIYSGGFNGGGYRYGYYGGGGGSDIRIGTDSLYARVIVAGGGGSDGATNKQGMFGGGTVGGSSSENYTIASNYCGKGGNTTYSGFSISYTASTQATTGLNSNISSYYRGGFGFGGGGIYLDDGYGGAGGGGWYGGSGTIPDSSSDDDRGGGGGSGYVYTSSTASQYPSGCLLNQSYYLANASTTAGNTSIPTTSGGTQTGHSGNGYVRITKIS